jgi:hypothetical protein
VLFVDPHDRGAMGGLQESVRRGEACPLRHPGYARHARAGANIDLNPPADAVRKPLLATERDIAAIAEKNSELAASARVSYLLPANQTAARKSALAKPDRTSTRANRIDHWTIDIFIIGGAAYAWSDSEE